MSIKRRFTKEELEELVRLSEEMPINQLARETKINKSTLYSNINRYKKEQKYKKQVAEMKAEGMEMFDICKELNLGLEEGESILALIEGREPKRILRNWTSKQKEQMYKMHCKGMTANEIAKVFNTTEMKVFKTIESYITQKRKEKTKKKAKKEYISSKQASMITKPREKYKGPSIAELNKQAKMHNLTYGQYIAMKEMLCQES